MKKKALILWLDAFRPDYLTKKNTPFLYSLSQKLTAGPHLPQFTFNATPSSFFTGQLPQKHNQFTIFWKNPKQKPLNLLSILPSNFTKYLVNLLRYAQGQDFFLLESSPPPTFSCPQDKFYTHQNALACPTIFDYLRKNDKTFLFLNWPIISTSTKTYLTPLTHQNDQKIAKKFLKLNPQKYNLSVLHLGQLDSLGHHFGPTSEEVKAHLKVIDSLAQKNFKLYDQKNDFLFIWSDHGMAKVKKYINIKKNLSPLHNFQFFINSTLLQLWFPNQKTKEKVKKQLLSLKIGSFLTSTQKKTLGLNFKHNYYGDELFILDEGSIFVPNHFTSKKDKGTHGYLDQKREECGIFISNQKIPSPARTTDFFPVLKTFLIS
jgi:hypothetical protein